MILRLLFCISLLALSACSGTSDPPLPVIHSGDPVRAMVPDRLEYGQLPK